MKIIQISTVILLLGMYSLSAWVYVDNRRSKSTLYLDVATHGLFGKKNIPIHPGEKKTVSTGADYLKKVTFTRDSKGGKKLTFSFSFGDARPDALFIARGDEGIMMGGPGKATLKNWDGNKE